MSWGDWRDHAACAGEDPEVFFPPRYVNATQAKRICAVCIVRTDCLEYALERPESHGIWGGKTVKERRSLRRQWLLKAAS